MHKKMSKALTGSLMAAAMMASSLTAVVAPMSASAKAQLLGATDFTKAQFGLADMNGDKAADIFDLVCLRKKLLK